jgi:hypothetical protein
VTSKSKRNAKEAAQAGEGDGAPVDETGGGRSSRGTKAAKATKATKSAKRSRSGSDGAEVPDDEAAPARASGGAKAAKTTKAAKSSKAAQSTKRAAPDAGGAEDGDETGATAGTTKKAAKAAKAAKAGKAAKAAKSTKTAKAGTATKATKTTKAAKATKGAVGESVTPEGTAADERSPRPSGAGEALNEPMTFLTFVADHPVGSTFEGTVVSFTSHGAHIDVDGMLCHVPLRYLADPPPNKARQVLTKGEVRTFELVSLDAARRRAELALPGLAG